VRKRKDEKRRRAIRERRCFVCGIFGHMARYCRNRGEEKRGSSMPQNKFEVLRDRVMQKGEGSGREIGKDQRVILREKREKKTKIQKKDLEKKEKMREVEKKNEKMEEEREVEMRGFSGGEILKVRYPLVWWKVRLLWDAWNMNNFYFLFLLFSDFIGILFSFSFFNFWTMKRHVTSQSHDVTS